MSRIRRVYSEYCKRHEASGQHLQELESRKDLKPFFEACQETCQGRTKTWDLGSFLIKPVQRVLKYPLLINQIHALTPPEHLDSEAIATVQRDMLQVAEEINEIKRRKDIVEKIVGPKMKKDSDFSRTTQQLRQTIGGSDVTVDILFEAFLEKFNFQQVLARDFTRYIVSWLVSIKQYFDTQEALALTLREVYNMVPIHRYDENRSIAKVSEFHKSLSQFSKTVGRELELRLKKTVYKSIENFLKLFAGPLQVMKKREKKLLDYDSVRGMKERGETVDKNMQESADAYVAINEQLLDELPKFLGLTTKYFDLIVMEFSKIQTFFYRQVKGKILEFFAKHINSSAAIDVPGYMATVDVCEEYITAMTKEDGALARLDRVTLVRGTIAAHAFLNMRETAHRRKRAASMSLHSRSRNSSTASHSPMLSPISERGSWHTKSGSALFECTAIYPYSTSEDRQLTFEAGETIVVFGLNEDGWYFGKKVGRDQTGWFPASHCIQI
ncbi:hypothetical protein B0O80DRAFT_382637 [Mortierella sp. GBAus27b]|nr:hypothetical protein B0O80DRAFT_382637 [Mortierella sp. GBAus27b]